ncbi:MAG: peptide deformylase [Oscillospiraceae bacterium]|nr:peptide deformylase [Oscillospiraceae bacterium]
MGLRKILDRSDEALRKKCRPVTDFGERTAALMDDLRETVVAANGAGLAAPQIGTLRRAAVIFNGEEIVELINPEIIRRAEEEDTDIEGCLSCPDERAFIARPKTVCVRAQNRHGESFELELEDFAARAACHELDHLDGVLFTDHADIVYTEEEFEELMREWAEEDEEDERLELEGKKRKKGGKKSR